MASVKDIYKFDELTWPEVNEAVEMGKIPIIPTGAVEQHGHHLPLKVDHLCANAVATEGRALKARIQPGATACELWLCASRHGFSRLAEYTLRTLHSVPAGHLQKPCLSRL